jgi:hypothetical protein
MDTKWMRWTVTPLLAVIAASISLAAGCGGDDSDGDDAGASDGSGAAAASSDRALKYSKCMRENGVPNFPDPQNGRFTLGGGPDGDIDPESPEFQAAQRACQSLAPQGGTGGGQANPQLQEQVLEFAKCMRKNGVSDFPDPDVSGGGVTMQAPQGTDPNSPQFRSAQQKCQSILQGLGGGAQ